MSVLCFVLRLYRGADCNAEQRHGVSFLPVFDGGKRKIPGVWLRGNRYHVQLRVDLGNGRTACGGSS